MSDPITYGPTGIRCGCGKDAHSNLVPCRDDETAAAVDAQGALPVPVGDQPQPLDDQRLAEIAARAKAASRGPWTLAYESCDCSEDCGHGLYVSRLDTGAGPATELLDLPSADWELMAHARQDVPALLAEVERLKAERHTTNEALTDAAETLRENRDRIAELEKRSATLAALEAAGVDNWDGYSDALDGDS
ncbi:hypothetical protein AB0872_20525 [Microbacterium sp. NPDC047426]